MRWSRCRAFALAVAVAGWGLPSIAQADTVLLLPPSGDARVVPALAERLREETISVLHEMEHEVLTLELAAERLERDLSECDFNCAVGLLDELDADVALLVLGWRNGEEIRAVARDTVAQGERTLPVVETLHVALQTAITAALNEFYRQPRSFVLRVNGSPEGAQVSIDGEVAGNLPSAWRTLPAGNHDVSVHKSGYFPFRETVTLTEPRALQVDLIPDEHSSSAGPTGTQRADRPPQWPRIFAGSLSGGAMLAGGILLATGLAWVARNGDCDEQIPGLCVRRRTIGPHTRRMLGLGVGALVLGAVGLTLTFKLPSPQSDERARASLAFSLGL